VNLNPFAAGPRMYGDSRRCTCYTASLALVKPSGPLPIFLHSLHCLRHAPKAGVTDGNQEIRKPLLTTMVSRRSHNTHANNFFECSTAGLAKSQSREAILGGAQKSSSSPVTTSPQTGSPTIPRPMKRSKGDVPGSTNSQAPTLTTSITDRTSSVKDRDQASLSPK